MKLKIKYKREYTAGILWRDEEGYHFKYDEDFITNDELPISVTMPKAEDVYHRDVLFPVFHSILSEGHNRKLQCKSLGIDLTDDWNLLAYTCQNDTIGAITVEIISD